MAAEIPGLKTSRHSAVVSSSGSFFRNLMPDGKRDSLYVLVLEYWTMCLYLYWWPLVAADNIRMCKETCIATMAYILKVNRKRAPLYSITQSKATY